MRLRDYFIGQPIRLTSPHSPSVVSERINEAAASRLWPFHTDTVVGGVWFGRVRLHYASSPFQYNAKPLLAGALREDRSGTMLDLRYRAPVWICIFNLVWFCILGLFMLMLLGLVGVKDPDLTNGDLAFAWTILLVLLAAPLAFHYIGTMNSDEELGHILDFLAEHVDAHP